MDDTYLLVTSESYKTNCDLLEKHFKEVMRWADINKVSFEPSKYEVMHFQHPLDKKKPRYKEVPNIVDGIENKTSIKILGVQVDHRLTGAEHMETVG